MVALLSTFFFFCPVRFFSYARFTWYPQVYFSWYPLFFKPYYIFSFAVVSYIVQFTMDSRTFCCALVLEAAATRLVASQGTTDDVVRAVLEAPWSRARSSLLGTRVSSFVELARAEDCSSDLLGLLSQVGSPVAVRPLLPADLWQWESLTKDMLSKGLKLETVSMSVRFLKGAGVSCPRALRSMGRWQLEFLVEGANCRSPIFSIWSVGAAARGPGPSMPMDAHVLANILSIGDIEKTPIATMLRKVVGKLELPGYPVVLSPHQLAVHVETRSCSPSDIRTFNELSALMRCMASFQGSLKSVASGLRAWARFCDITGEPHFPPTCASLVRFSAWCRSSHTYGLYLSHVKKACLLLGMPTAVFGEDSLRVAKVGIGKMFPAQPRERPSITLPVVMGVIRGQPLSEEYMFVIISWVFLLRAASEAVSVRRAREGVDLSRLSSAPSGSWVGLSLSKKTLFLKLQRRKNKPLGDVLERGCSCSAVTGVSDHCGRILCPVHVLWPCIASRISEGSSLISCHDLPRSAATWVRHRLQEVGIMEAEHSGLHDLRRGAAQQLVSAGCSLSTILQAGSWSSRAFIDYLDRPGVERDLVTKIKASAVLIDDE